MALFCILTTELIFEKVYYAVGRPAVDIYVEISCDEKAGVAVSPVGDSLAGVSNIAIVSVFSSLVVSTLDS